MPARHLRWPVAPRAPAARPVTQLALGAATTSSLGDCLPSLPRGSQPAPRGGLSRRRPYVLGTYVRMYPKMKKRGGGGGGCVRSQKKRMTTGAPFPRNKSSLVSRTKDGVGAHPKLIMTDADDDRMIGIVGRQCSECVCELGLDGCGWMWMEGREGEGKGWEGMGDGRDGMNG